jgi:hypothetical protein
LTGSIKPKVDVEDAHFLLSARTISYYPRGAVLAATSDVLGSAMPVYTTTLTRVATIASFL